MIDKLKSLYIDMPQWKIGVIVDDFLVAIGKTKSNSVYHVAKVKRIVDKPEKKLIRYYLSVYKSELTTALRRDKTQHLIPIQWYNRNKK